MRWTMVVMLMSVVVGCGLVDAESPTSYELEDGEEFGEWDEGVAMVHSFDEDGLVDTVRYEAALRDWPIQYRLRVDRGAEFRFSVECGERPWEVREGEHEVVVGPYVAPSDSFCVEAHVEGGDDEQWTLSVDRRRVIEGK